MTAPAIQQDDQQQDDPVVAAVKLMVAHGVPSSEIEAYVAKKRGASISPARASAKAFAAEPFATENETGLPNESTGDRMAGALSAGYQGMTGGLGTKMIAGLQSLAGGQRKGTNKPALPYGDALSDQQAVLDQHKQNHPAEALGEEIAGTVPSTFVDLPVAGVSAMRGMLNAAKSAPAIAEHIPVVGRAIRVGRIVGRIADKYGSTEAAAAPEVAASVAPPATQSVEGLQGPMGSLEDMMQEGGLQKGPQSIDELVAQKPNPGSTAVTRHRTKAQFDYMAERMANRVASPAQSVEDGPDLAEQLRQSLQQVRGRRLLPAQPSPP